MTVRRIGQLTIGLMLCSCAPIRREHGRCPKVGRGESQNTWPTATNTTHQRAIARNQDTGLCRDTTPGGYPGFLYSTFVQCGRGEAVGVNKHNGSDKDPDIQTTKNIHEAATRVLNYCCINDLIINIDTRLILITLFCSFEQIPPHKHSFLF